MGWFLVFYTETEGMILNVVVAIAAIVICSLAIKLLANNTGMKLWKILKYTLHTFGVLILSVLVGASLCIFMGIMMDLLHMPLSWYTHNWLILGLYFCPFYFGLAIVPALYFQYTATVSVHLDLLSIHANRCLVQARFPIGQRVQLLMHCHCLFLALLILVFTICHIRSAYILMLGCLFYTVGLVFNVATGLHSRSKLQRILFRISDCDAFSLQILLG